MRGHTVRETKREHAHLGQIFEIDSQIYYKKEILIIDPPIFGHFERDSEILFGQVNDLVETLAPSG